MDAFRAYRIYEQDGEVQGRLETTEIDTLSPGDVVIRAVWSDVNYKDALAGSGKGKILKRFPLIGGIDVAGQVYSSIDPRFKETLGRHMRAEGQSEPCRVVGHLVAIGINAYQQR